MIFNYSVTDRLGNVIEEETVRNSTVGLYSASFVSVLSFDENGDCQVCEEGVWLSAVSVEDNVGETYTLQVSANNDRLVLAQSELTVNVTGCPIGYGVDSTNYSCAVCDVGTYNIESDFVRDCHSCYIDPGIC